jgi:pimeloyl-ACP methyl ester carboxylesterase
MSHALQLALGSLLLTACASTATVEHHRADFAAGRVHYLEVGSGSTAIVLVHGWASDTDAWRHQVPALADLGHLIVVDLPGHGESELPGEYSMALFADSILAVLDDAGVDRAVLVGHSNGSPVALSFYLRHPHRTSGLVVVDGAVRSVMEPEAAEPMFGPFRAEDWQDAMTEMIDGMPAPGLSDEDRAAIREMALRQPHASIVGGFETAVDPNSWSDQPIDVPFLALMTDSPFWDDDYVAHVYRRAPHVDYVVWEDTGHWVQMERPDDFRAALEAFLTDNELP